MQLPNKCPECGEELEYLSEVHLIANTEPQETGIEGNCFKCGAMVYSQFRMYKAEVTLFDEYGNEKETKEIT
jgi:uncharacterized protein with PIN domain